MLKQKSLFTPWKLWSIKKSKYWFGAFCVVVFYWYWLQFIVHLNPGFNSYNNFALYWVDNVKNGTWKFVSVIENVISSFSAALYITEFLDQVRMRLVLPFINNIWRVLQKLLKYFNDTITLCNSTIMFY